MSSTPSQCQSRTFDNGTYKRATLYVPTGSAEAYRNAAYWRNFQNIVEFDPSSIEGIAGENGRKPQPVYDLQGRRLQQPQRGLNIIGGKKVLRTVDGF